MKAICIDSVPVNENTNIHLTEGKEYDIVKVDDTYVYANPDNKGNTINVHYFTKRFLPTSSIDETERIDEIMETIFINKSI